MLHIEVAEEIANEFLNDYELDHGNAEVIEQDGDLYVSIEARRNTTLGFWMNKNEVEACESREEFVEYLKYMSKVVVNEFEVDEKFDEIWNVGFGKNNGFTAREFISLLDDDKEYFERVVGEF